MLTLFIDKLIMYNVFYYLCKLLVFTLLSYCLSVVMQVMSLLMLIDYYFNIYDVTNFYQFHQLL